MKSQVLWIMSGLLVFTGCATMSESEEEAGMIPPSANYSPVQAPVYPPLNQPYSPNLLNESDGRVMNIDRLNVGEANLPAPQTPPNAEQSVAQNGNGNANGNAQANGNGNYEYEEYTSDYAQEYVPSYVAPSEVVPYEQVLPAPQDSANGALPSGQLAQSPLPQMQNGALPNAQNYAQSSNGLIPPAPIPNPNIANVNPNMNPQANMGLNLANPQMNQQMNPPMDYQMNQPYPQVNPPLPPHAMNQQNMMNPNMGVAPMNPNMPQQGVNPQVNPAHPQAVNPQANGMACYYEPCPQAEQPKAPTMPPVAEQPQPQPQPQQAQVQPEGKVPNIIPNSPVLETEQVIELSAVGMGVAPENTISPSQALAMAKRAAIIDAYRQIGEKMYGIKINGKDTVKDMVMTNSVVKAQVEALIKNADIVETIYKDGLCQVTMELKLDSRTWNRILSTNG